tara:strand:+ start:2795 stop:4006 length:1212 start_codon:yes stop_codon:yes gene_type:complete
MINKLLDYKKDFPIFNNQDIIYLDTASTSQKPNRVINTITQFYQTYNANVHRGLYAWAEKATFEYESSRNKIADYINAENNELIFTKGTTESINFISNAWGLNNITNKNNIVITEMEHHSNIVPWQILSKKTGAELRYIPISDNGQLDLDNISKIIDDNTKIVSIIHQSNVFGTINPIDRIALEAHKKGALILIDAAQSIAHQEINVKNMNCDFLVFSGHKVLGPTGIGCLYIKKDHLNDLEPYQTGGQMISRVNEYDSTWNDSPFKFEAGTPNIVGAIGLGVAIDYLKEINISRVKIHNQIITEYCLDELRKIDKLEVYGHINNNTGPVISFNIDGIHSYDLAQLLAQQKIYIRSGHHCAQPIMRKLNIESSNRLSLYIYNDLKDIDCFIKAIKNSINMLKG